MIRRLLLVVVLLVIAAPALAQEGLVSPGALTPASYRLDNITHIYQGWNNCGPATLTMALTYYGYRADQNPAAQWLKPNSEDKNVTPAQMVAYVNTQLDGGVRALKRYGGTLERLQALISSEFTVLIEAGYDPVSANQGWMGHYLLMVGYDNGQQTFTTHDSYDGPNLAYSYDHVREYWQHFNNVYIVVYPPAREAELMALLGTDADERQNAYNALSQSIEDARADGQNAFAWHNVGSNWVMMGDPVRAAAAYDTARNIGLPWRMLWYQFGIYEAYLATARYDDVIALARATLNDGGGQFVEETYYYAALAREGLGQRDRAIDNLNGAIAFNPNFAAARDARARLGGG